MCVGGVIDCANRKKETVAGEHKGERKEKTAATLRGSSSGGRGSGRHTAQGKREGRSGMQWSQD